MRGYVILNDNKISPNLTSVAQMNIEIQEAQAMIDQLNQDSKNADWKMKNISELEQSEDPLAEVKIAFTNQSKMYENYVLEKLPAAQIVSTVIEEAEKKSKSDKKVENAMMLLIIGTIALQILLFLLK